MLKRRLLEIQFAACLAAMCLSANSSNAQSIGSDGCTDEERDNAGHYGCVCVDHQPAGGFCDGSGCTDIETHNCNNYGTVCVDHQCSGGFTTGTGCTAKELTNCGKVGANCVDHQCSGGFAPGNGCTAREITDCGNVGCDCNEHKCAGGFCSPSAPPPNLGPAPVVRVKGAADNDVKTVDIHTSIDDMNDDNNPNSYFESGRHMGRAIQTLANFSTDYIIFGEKESGFFGHGQSVCIGPRTFVNLASAGFDRQVPLCQGGDPGPYIPFLPEPFSFLFTMTGGQCSGDSYRTVKRHFAGGNFANKLMSYVGVSDRDFCEGPSGVNLINRGMEGTQDLDRP